MPSYQFIIPNKKLVTYQVFSYAIILLNIAGLYLLSPQQEAWGQGIYLLLLFLAVFRGIWDYRAYKKQKGLMSNVLLLVIIALFWSRTEYNMGIWINLLLAGLYFISTRKLKIIVSEEGVSYPTFPAKIIPWSEISNLILKDDILTIDLKNNKIYQHLVEYTDNAANEPEFNDFCRTKLV
ncbi:hypothetical protein ACLOAU_17910 [Niabella sp. CJ426]|uniref:hypothetical protein n=1 Tax=Niabella sp. CJ426 TaxID=3393740 RepID=UPI003D017AC0